MAVYPAIARRLLEQPFNEGNLEAIDQIVPADGVVRALFAHPDSASGRDLLKSIARAQRAEVPDLHVELDQLLNAGHTITALCTLSGTGRDGRHAAWNMIAIMHFHDAKVVETWITIDRLGMYQQLGLIPESVSVLEEAGIR